ARAMTLAWRCVSGIVSCLDMASSIAWPDHAVRLAVTATAGLTRLADRNARTPGGLSGCGTGYPTDAKIWPAWNDYPKTAHFFVGAGRPPTSFADGAKVGTRGR